MKILLDSYNNSFQHIGGGVPMKVQMYHQYFQTPDITTKLFDKWNDKLADYDILHIVKLTVDNCAQIKFAKDLGKKVVISAVIPQIEPLKIKIALLLKKYLKISSLYSLIYQSLKLADSIIVETSIEANFIINNYNISKSKIVVIPNGVNQQILDNFENDMSVSKDIVLCVGRFDSNKNQLNLIRALRGTDYQLHFIGGSSPYDNSYYTKCKDAAKEYGNIHFHGGCQMNLKSILIYINVLELYALCHIMKSLVMR